MTLFASDYSWPTGSSRLDVSIGTSSHNVGTLVDHDRLWLHGADVFPYSSSDPKVEVRAAIDGQAAVLVGQTSGTQKFLVDEVWSGVDQVPDDILCVETTLQGLAEVVAPTGGRSSQQSGSARVGVRMPGDSRTFLLAIDGPGAQIETRDGKPAPLEHFENHLDALQDLTTFLTRRSSGRGPLEVTWGAGHTATVHGRVRFASAARREGSPAHPLVSLGDPGGQALITKWWKARQDIQPVTQIAAGIVYGPIKFVEAELAVTAAAIDRLVNVMTDPPKKYEEAVVKAIVDAVEGAVRDLGLDQKTQGDLTAGVKQSLNHIPLRSRILGLAQNSVPGPLNVALPSVDTWVQDYMDIRNPVAHALHKPKIWTDGDRLRRTRDANRRVLALALLKHLGASDVEMLGAARVLSPRRN